MRWAAAFVALVLIGFGGLLTVALGVPRASSTGSASPAASLACSVKASPPGCDVGAGEVAVFRMSSTGNAHAGTPGGSSYANVVCCGGVHNLSAACSAVYDRVVTLSGTDNAHVAADLSYGTSACLSVPHGVADCAYGATCATDYQCLATVSGSSNAHVADCDGVGDYATKLCCYVEDDNDNDGVLDPPDPDDDNDQFGDSVEAYLATDPWDACPDVIGVDDAWPLDIDMTRDISVTGDVFNYRNRIGAKPGDPAWRQRLDLDQSGDISATGDVFMYRGRIGETCT